MNRFFKAAALALGLLFWTNAGVSEAAQADMARASGLRVYAAQPGDNFVLLSARLGYDAEFLAALNNLSAGYCCRGGEILRLPSEAWTDAEAAAERRETTPLLAARGGGDKQARGAAGGRIWQRPLLEDGIVTSAFGASRSGGPGHHGTDIAVPADSPILAVHGGTVLEAGWKNDVYGNAVLLDHGNGWQTLYAHCNSVLVQVGQRVEQGQRIALVGSTGNSTGPHLHLELHKDGVCLNPARYIKELAV